MVLRALWRSVKVAATWLFSTKLPNNSFKADASGAA